ncbi:MAG TPA: hypothetical protein VMT19_12330 [Thermoanaerobaculaceae bacterium]|nr:hypothetical protein [Thermoanaerobaculaceae bacterium]
MDRKAFLKASLGAAAALGGAALGAAADEPACAARLESAERESVFVNGWLDDLFDGIDAELDAGARVRLLEACGRGCYRRHPFKQEIARKGSGGLAQLEKAYRESFEAWRDGDVLHIRYGAVSKGCYCPAARRRPPRPHDLHCECTRTTHQTICETALGRPCRVEILETVRRGGATCHFAVHPA